MKDKSVDVNSLIVHLGASPDAADAYKFVGANALHSLFRHYKHDNMIDLARSLIEARFIDIDAQDSIGRNALHFLFQYYHHDNLIELVYFLVEKGITNVNAQTVKTGWSPLHVLFRYYKHGDLFDITNLLIEREVDLNLRNMNGWSPLHHLCRYYNHENLLDIVLLLKQNNIDLRARTEYGHSAFRLLSTVWKSFMHKNRVIAMIQSEDENLPTLLDYFYDWLTGSIDDSLNDDE